MKTFYVMSTISWEIIGSIVASSLRQAETIAGFKFPDEPIKVVQCFHDSDLAVLDAA